MIKQTTEAKIEFHEQYWSKVSDEGELMVDGVNCMLISSHTAKSFIKLLLNPHPSQRPTAQQALNNHVSHESIIYIILR